MTPQETLAAAQLMTEWAQSVIEGKPIEIECRAKDCAESEWTLITVLGPRWDWFTNDYRRKPQPKRVPLEAKDVPPGSVVKCFGTPVGCYWSVVQVSFDGIHLNNGDYFMLIPWNKLMEDEYVISRDNGKTWEGCWKEVME